jgi:cytochrome c-type biogenesis protein
VPRRSIATILALAAGMVASFTLTGFLIATLGASIGLNSDTVWIAGALLLLLLGIVLFFPALGAVRKK